MTQDPMTPEETGCVRGPEVDPFAAARAGFADLVQGLTAPAAGDLSHDRLEELIETRGWSVLRQLARDYDNLRVARGERGLATRSPTVGGPDR